MPFCGSVSKSAETDTSFPCTTSWGEWAKEENRTSTGIPAITLSIKCGSTRVSSSKDSLAGTTSRSFCPGEMTPPTVCVANATTCYIEPNRMLASTIVSLTHSLLGRPTLRTYRSVSCWSQCVRDETSIAQWMAAGSTGDFSQELKPFFQQQVSCSFVVGSRHYRGIGYA